MDVSFLAKLSSREKKIAVVTAVCVLFLLAYHGVWSPITERFGKMDEQIFAMQLNLRKAKTLIRQRTEILDEAKKYPNLEQMDARRDEEEIASLLNFIEKEARRASVSLSDVKPQQVNQDRLSKRYVIELTAESGLKELIEFVYALQYSSEMLRVERVECAPKEEKSPVLRTALVVTRVVVK